MEEKQTDIGVIIGRFQIHELHQAHIDLIETVLSKHEKVIVFLGTSVTITRKNPLDFLTRKLMLDNEFGNKISVILPLPDQKCDLMWSHSIDVKIKEVFNKGTVTLYGSRDSFISHYKGIFKTKELEPTVYVSATKIRDKIAKAVQSTSIFRAGVIYGTYAQWPSPYPTVDIVIRNGDKILLGKKPNENEWRFVGGFVDSSDENYESAAKREALEETGLELDSFKYICSKKIQDWRYKGTERSIITTLFEATYIFGTPSPNDDISELKWFDINSLPILVDEHKNLMNIYLQNE